MVASELLKQMVAELAASATMRSRGLWASPGLCKDLRTKNRNQGGSHKASWKETMIHMTHTHVLLSNYIIYRFDTLLYSYVIITMFYDFLKIFHTERMR